MRLFAFVVAGFAFGVIGIDTGHPWMGLSVGAAVGVFVGRVLWPKYPGAQDSFSVERERIARCLKHRGLRLVHQDPVDRRSFGNTFADLESVDLRLRLTKDRGQLLVDVGPPAKADWENNGDRWYPLPSVLWFLDRSVDVRFGDPVLPKLLDDKWQDVTRLFAGGADEKAALDEALRKRFYELSGQQDR